MNIFQIHSEILSEYESYISSFIDINDDRIKDYITEYFKSHKLWPQPLIQFNPSYKIGESIDDLIKTGILNESLRPTFEGYNLYQHQVDAIKLGVNKKSFVVTSGTGSGKSLTYLASIFNYLLSTKTEGVKALIVYPMNALINSQSEEIKKYQEKFKNKTGSDFPISFAQYTGQESRDEKDQIVKSPPSILLTNYMMLELIMTRLSEKQMRESLLSNIEFIVFDELHTYRGRQGSDVSMLIRRINALSQNHITYVGTSATMVFGKSIDEQKLKVAEIAGRIFGQPFDKEQIINETLVSNYSNEELLTSENLRSFLTSTAKIGSDKKSLFQNPLSIWIEKEIALDTLDGILIRKKPLMFNEIAEQLASYSGIDQSICLNKIKELMVAANNYNTLKDSSESAVLPFKIHQFISQTGTVYATLEDTENREITLDYVTYKNSEYIKKQFYNIVFSRITGVDFICVKKEYSKSKLIPREFTDKEDDEFDDDHDFGYLLLDNDQKFWSEGELARLPDNWIQEKPNGDVVVKKNYKDSIPKKIYFDASGTFSEKDISLPYWGWYIPFPLLFDPTSGVFYDRKTSENTKLSKLGIEGRSTSTTILSLSTIKSLGRDNQIKEQQKLLSFSDNRQDAALQAGQFNDFYKNIRIRSAIFSALKNAPNQQLDYSELPQKVVDELSLPQKEYATAPADIEYPAAVKENEEAFRHIINYRIFQDLKRGWRVVLPNLEQCGLLDIKYKNLEESIRSTGFSERITLTKSIDEKSRFEFVSDVLDYFRKNYAISHSLLEKNERTRLESIIKEKVKSDWGLSKKEAIPSPAFARVEALKLHGGIFTISFGMQSYLGKYIKHICKENNIELNTELYKESVYQFLDELEKAGFLCSQRITSGGQDAKIYQLKVDKIYWCMGDGTQVKPDRVRLFSYKSYQPKVNEYFKSLYQTDFNKLKYLQAAEHTAQVGVEDRKERERDFRDGKLSLLSCSPTMELGIDISTLNVVHLRNVPPNPANYAQRSGRAGRSGAAALILAYCSNYSPHDQHYFNKPSDMVSGQVMPPRIDLINQELLECHLHSLYMAEVGLKELDNSFEGILDINDGTKLSIYESIKEHITLKQERKIQVFNSFKIAISDFEHELKKKTEWYTDDWIRRAIEQTPNKFDSSIDRWRELYKSARSQFVDAQRVLSDVNLTNDSDEKKAAYAAERQANKQIDILLNRSRKNKSSNSEFYPYRYLASEGFFPGYNFTRLPIRAYVAEGQDDGEFISRPRFLAMREFGPGNVIYHNSKKYKISQLIINDAESKIEKMKVSNASGYALVNEEYDKEVCPFTNVSLKTTEDITLYNDLLPMSDVRTYEIDRISCSEEDRISMGYDIKTFFTVKGRHDKVVTSIIKKGDDELLKLKYIPASTLIKINDKWRTRKHEPGFLIDIKYGFWKKEKDLEKENSDIKRIRLFTEDTADALYIHPLKALGFDDQKFMAGVVTLMYAIKRGIENVFQVEPNEIGVELMGTTDWPNMMIYEASEGSLGILSQLVENPTKFKQVIEEAYSICHFKDGEDQDPEHKPATYQDLLSYYNQRYHQDIDRHLIKEQLEKLFNSSMDVLGRSKFTSYEDHYSAIKKNIDPNSVTEVKFLDYLYKNGYKLPDVAQYNVPHVYVKPDFFYSDSKTCVFCDGTPHDVDRVKEHDKEIRKQLINKGYDVFVYYYTDLLEEIISKRPDIFKKVR